MDTSGGFFFYSLGRAILRRSGAICTFRVVKTTETFSQSRARPAPARAIPADRYAASFVAPGGRGVAYFRTV